jgi:hypothetical protein
VVALGEEEIAQKAAKTGFLGTWILGIGQMISWIHGRPSGNWGQVGYQSIVSSEGLRGLGENGQPLAVL